MGDGSNLQLRHGQWLLALTFLIGLADQTVTVAQPTESSAAVHTPPASEDPPSVACEQDERRRQLDFWLGEWQVVDPEGVVVGTNRIEKLQQGCLIHESWTSAGGGTGESMNYFDPAAGKWRQNWVDGRGGVVIYEGELLDGAMHFSGVHVSPKGGVSQARVVLKRLPQGRLHHRIEHSDDGRTWSTYFDGTYIPSGEALPVAPPRPAPGDVAPGADVALTPAAEPSAAAVTSPPQEGEPIMVPAPASDEVTALSSRELVGTKLQPVALTSPMVLEVAVGELPAIPEGYEWSSDEVANYICERASIRRVGVSRKTKGQQVELRISALLHSTAYLQRLDFEVELLSGQQVVANERLEGISVGTGIPAHKKAEGLLQVVSFKMAGEEFDQLFEGDQRPALRLTLRPH